MNFSKLHGLLFLCWFTYIAAYLCRLSFASALPKLADGLSLPAEYLGLAASTYFIVYAVSQLINGFIGDRVNPYGYIILATAVTSAANLLIAASSSFLSIAVIWAVNGFCQAIFWGVFLRLLSFSFPAENRRMVSTVMSTASNIGILVSWTGLGLLFAHRSWQVYFAVPGVIMVLLIPLWLLMSRLLPAGDIFHGHRDGRNRPAFSQSLADLGRMRIQHICLLCCLIGFIKEGMAAWAPTIFSQMLNLRPGSSLVLLAVVPVANILGVFTGRAMLVRTNDDCRTTILRLLSLVVLCAALMTTVGDGLPLLMVALIGLLCMLANASAWVIISFLPLSFAGRNMVSTVVGIFDFSIYAGASAASGLMGFLLARFGWPSIPFMWIVVAGLAITSCLGRAGTFLRTEGNFR